MKIHALVFSLALVAACEPAPPTRAPTLSAEPPAPIVTPAPQTTVAMLTPTPPVPPLATPTRAPLLAALNKTQAARVYRVTMELNVRIGNVPPFAFNLQGEVNNDDSRYTHKLGSESIEMLTVGGQPYVKGARALGVPNLTKWYAVTPDLADAARFPFNAQDTLSEFAAQASNRNFSAGAREPLDGLSCQVWSYRPASLADAGIGKTLALDAPNSAFGVLEQAEMKLWPCADGALHQLSAEIAGHKSSTASEKGNLRLLIQIWDYDSAAIKITAPANAEPFQLRAP